MIEWQLERSPRGRLEHLQFAPISFDASFQEIFATGATRTLVLIDDGCAAIPAACSYLVEQQVHRLFLVRLLAPDGRDGVAPAPTHAPA